jgi:glycine cleavage system aminomethyltransferase T
MAYVPAAQARAGTPLVLDVRGREVAADVVPLPFYTGGSRKAPPRRAPTA